VIQTEGLGKRYGDKWALAECSLRVPTGTMAGLVGPNGAGKTTLLSMITGMLPPTAGRIQVAGGAPAAGPGQLAKVGFVAQDAPVYAGMSIAEAARDISLADYSSWGDSERIAVNVASLYREFSDGKTTANVAELFGLMAQLHRDRRN